MKLSLPWPPSVNHYYRRVGPRTLISRKGREYRREICGLLAPGGGKKQPPLNGSIALAMDAFPPDRRRRDLDNLLKCTQDTLAHAGIYEDDSQIDLLIVSRCDPVKGGKVTIKIDEFPLRRCPLCGGDLPQNESDYYHDN
ncbi:MAG TPA: RusA family crossover junction endodeoxyribonuclease [Phycisphaerae bacterium]|nr:RusA family crossover junction endodeoxyribonuclease [Phycisphaerae bacterium]